MTFIEWLMVATGLMGAVFFAIGIACALAAPFERWREKRRVIRAASWK